MELRPYQKAAVESVFKEWDCGRRRTLLVQATGTGKTICMAQIVADLRKQKEEKILLLAHRGELLDQARDKIEAHTGIIAGLEKAESTAHGDSVIVGSVQSMQNDRLLKYAADYFDTVMIDEAHHSVSPTYQNILAHFRTAKVLGVTATADRADRQNLGKVYDSIAYEYDMKTAIKDGYLVPLKAQLIPLELDISNVRVTSGDFSASDLGDALEPYLDQIADKMAVYCKGRKTLVFLPLIATSQKFCQILCNKGMKAAEVNGGSEDRAQILKEFEDGKYDILCNSMLLTEGYDCPAVDCIVCLRPTKSRALYVQIVGRATRLCPERGKKDALILDFLWHSKRHQLCKPAVLMAKDEAEAEAMSQVVSESDEPMDLSEAQEIVVKDAVAKQEESLRKQLEAQRNKRSKLIDPLQYEFAISADDLVDYAPTFAWEMEPASKKQLQAIENMGIDPSTVQNKGYACKLMEILMKRLENGMATPKQIKLLDRYGFRDLDSWTKDQASQVIGRLAENRWRMPYGMNPYEYVPA